MKTGAALFNWREDKDILTRPPEPLDNFTLRVIETKGTRRAQGFFNVRESIIPAASFVEKEKKCNVM